MESNLNPEIIHDTIDKEPRPEESRKEEARREPILVKGQQTWQGGGDAGPEKEQE